MEGYWVFDTFMMKASMEGAWTVSEGRAFQSFTVQGKKENCLWSAWQAYCQ